jgi:rare lipoprotein A
MLAWVALAAGCASVPPPATQLPREAPAGSAEEGLASYYGPGLQGSPTASGERFDDTQLTAAHRTLPFGTIVRVDDLENGKSVEVRINDRGPFTAGRIIDLSLAAARAIDMVRAGLARVRVTVVQRP